MRIRVRLAFRLSLVAALPFVALGCGDAPGDAIAAEPAGFVGGASCTECHRQEHDLWTRSHHDLAMQEASADTVLGDFGDATFTHFGVTSTFHRDGDRFLVRTDGPDGELRDYEIAYTFGVTPLQQYLIRFPGGRMQVLGICWDARPAEAGGQRWFHLYPDEAIPHDDELHWTGPSQNWNFMCAECHSTDLHKGYDLEHDRYQTTWSEIDVSCEACHGPGSRHVAWARNGADQGGHAHADRGLEVTLGDRDGGAWVFEPGKVTATRTPPRESHAQIESCARCHSRRSSMTDDYVHGRPLMDSHLPALLEESLYHADGQILDEVYVYGSFLQSKMYHAGVTCTDCHDPHTARARSTTNDLCARCHLPSAFDTPEHHHHEAGTAGAACVECHMPARNYMVVDPRLDHSIRVPRPDVSVKIGTPNACNRCHTAETARWAADAVAEWYGPDRRQEAHFGEVLHRGRTAGPRAADSLARLAGDPAQPGIARATALAQLESRPGPAAASAARAALEDRDPLVRRAALTVLEALPPAQRAGAIQLLTDPVRAVRIEAARVLAPLRASMVLPESYRASFDGALQEYVDAQLANADRASAHVNLGLLAVALGDAEKAEAAYRTALGVEPRSVPAAANLADLYRSRGRDGDGEGVLGTALQQNPDSAELHHALGLLLVRQKRLPEALSSLQRAAEVRPENPRFAYVWAVGLTTAGELDRGLAVLQDAHQRHPTDVDLLLALVTINRDHDRLDAALRFCRELVALAPQDPAAAELQRELEARRR